MKNFVNNKGVKIYFQVEGKGNIPLVLVPGFGGDRNLWKYNAPSFKEHFKVLSIDNRGAGESDKPDYPYTMQMFSSDIKAVMDEVGIKKAYILGASMGGLITLQVFRDYPEVVKGLILCCTTTGIPKRLQTIVNKMIKNQVYNVTSSMVIPAVVGIVNSFMKSRKKAIGSLADFELPEVDMNVINLLIGRGIGNLSKEELLKKIYASVIYRVTDEVKEFFEDRLYRHTAVPNKSSQLDAVLACSHHDIIKKINVPTMIIHGKHDKILRVSEAFFMNRSIKHSDMIIYGNCGHFLFVENYKQFNEDVIRTVNNWEATI